jgi:hypothetical protein
MALGYFKQSSVAATLLCTACSTAAVTPPGAGADLSTAAGPIDGGPGGPDAGPPADAAALPDSAAADAAGPLTFLAVTFNTGTNKGMRHDDPPADGYGQTEADQSDLYYGDGLAWRAAIEDVRLFLAGVKPDLIVFQEIFHPADCPAVPAGARKGFVCETWASGDPTVTQMVLGAGYQVACNLGKPDKCMGVKLAFGAVHGCTGALCLDGLAGAKVSGCGSGSRIGRGVIDLVAGGTLTVVNVHGSSGFSIEDNGCREKQVAQVFVDLDGAPAANGARNVVLGDFNTDPGRLTAIDVSAAAWAKHVGPGKPFHFISDVGPTATPTYAPGFNIDHVVSDTFTGSCWAAGITAGHPAPTPMTYFDHRPIVCTLTAP